MSWRIRISACSILTLAPVGLMALCIPGEARAISSIDQKAVVFRLCTVVVDDYTAYLAGLKTPKNLKALEREYANCDKVIEEYEDLVR